MLIGSAMLEISEYANAEEVKIKSPRSRPGRITKPSLIQYMNIMEECTANNIV
jgi:hypothetical protein